MSIVIVGGNECMTCIYEGICRSCGCRAKIFTKMRDGLNTRFGSPDLMILFTNTVSHKMVQKALVEAKRAKVPVARSHSSSASALKEILDIHLPRLASGKEFA